MEAKFIVIEGIDGTGTTTQSLRLRNALVARGERCILTSEPTPGPIGSVIRLALGGRLSLCPATNAAPAGEEALYALLFAADRLDHLLNEINPALDAATHVVTDRYYLSSFAYQGTRCDLAWLRQLNARARKPDVTFLFDADPAVCLERIGKERHGRERYETLEHLRAIRDNYLRIAEILRTEGEQIVLIDATKPIEAVHEEILRHVLSADG
ncbi:MAG: dTMP kinase [Planctomycetes bacterium]|nr:dTMP kinase [Planctomycetota bacterium]